MSRPKKLLLIPFVSFFILALWRPETAAVGFYSPGGFNPFSTFTQTIREPKAEKDPIQLIAKNYPQIRDLSLEILKKYPPKRYYYIGIGRSPTPLVTFFKNLDQSSIKSLNLPLSRMDNFDIESSRLTTPLKESAAKHLSRFIPTPELVAGRTLLFIDYTVSAGRFINTVQLLKWYLSQYRKDSRIKVLALKGFDPTHLQPKTSRLEDYIKTTQASIDVIDMHAYPSLQEALFDTAFDEFAEYGEYSLISPNPNSLIPNRKHQALKEALVSSYQKDCTLSNLKKILEAH